MKYLAVLSFLLTLLVHLSQGCNKTVDCIAPACRCMDTENPGGLSVSDTPQLVFLSFDGAITTTQLTNYTNIFKNRVNPNRCPISATFFVNHDYNDYNITNYMFNKGHEIASFTMTGSRDSGEVWKTKSASEWSNELGDMRTAIAKYANIPQSNIRGFRAPYLQTNADETLQAVKSLGLLYAATFPTYTYINPPIWPYTMDFGLQHECVVEPCPIGSAAGVWNVPMITLSEPTGDKRSMADAYQSNNTVDTYNYLVNNFNRHRNSNKAPFGVYLNANSWFNQYGTAFRMTAYLQFLDYLATFPDVYIVSIGRGIDWMRNPVNFSTAGATGGPFACPAVQLRSCTARNCYYDEGASPVGARYLKICTACPSVFPWVGNPNGV